ncbi:MAG TPA: hypothetical protein ENH00_01340 [Actinobacteria bacterium]|nr:putative HTH-type transcriptional regulator/MT0914 [bacterium BMS3Bbin01]HDH24823.1 hypothetical protein [Actinomycetota bacterium]
MTTSGPPLNRAARLLGTGHGGQVLISTATREIVADAGFDLVDLGHHRIRDLNRPEHIYQLRYPDLPASFPPLRSLNTRPHNLPVKLTSFVGRDAEVREVTKLLAETRLVTLGGVGGAGKTRLALHVAAEMLDSYGDGGWVVELAPISDPELVVNQAAEPFGVRAVETTGSRRLVDVLADYLANKHVLLVLDNCEHALESSALVAETPLTRCSGLTILATSRELLAVPGKVVYSIPPLSLPMVESTGLEGADAVLLFVDRAALEGFRELQNPYGVVKSLRRMGRPAAAMEEPERATRLLATAEVLRESVGGSLSVHDRKRTDAVTESLEAAATPSRFAQWWAAAAAMDTDEAVALALAE